MAIEKDPVCGMDVDTETSTLSLEHEGKTYWFCGKGCMLEFRDDPDKYLDPGVRAGGDVAGATRRTHEPSHKSPISRPCETAPPGRSIEGTVVGRWMAGTSCPSGTGEEDHRCSRMSGAPSVAPSSP